MHQWKLIPVSPSSSYSQRKHFFQMIKSYRKNFLFHILFSAERERERERERGRESERERKRGRDWQLICSALPMTGNLCEDRAFVTRLSRRLETSIHIYIYVCVCVCVRKSIVSWYTNCSICFRLMIFSDSSVFLFHLTARPRFTCQQCGRGYTMLCNLRRHINRECGGKRQFPCFYCGYSFTQKTSLQRHVIAIHKIDVVKGMENLKWKLLM